MTAATAFPQLVVHRCPVAGSLDGQVASGAHYLADRGDLPATHCLAGQAIQDDHSLDRPVVALVQTPDPLVEKARLVARFPVEAELAVLLILGVLGVLDLDVRLQVFRIQGLSDVQDEGAPGRDVQAAKVNHDQDDRARDQRLEGRCNTRFLF